MLIIRCTFLRGVFEGGSPDDPPSAEWPPSWMRLFSALVSVAEPGSGDDAVLHHLEGADSPDIKASEATTTNRTAFVPTNAIHRETRHGTLVGRTNGERVWARAAPRFPHVWYRWPRLDLDSHESDRLKKLCRRVPYIGRSTSPVLLAPVDDPGGDGWLRPRSATETGQSFGFEVSIRSPTPGSLDALREAYEASAAPWQVGSGVDYGRVVEDSTESKQTGPYRTLIVLQLEGPRRHDGRHTARVTQAFRRALLSRASEHLAVLHGHHDGDIVQCAFLGLVDVGHEHADGHLLGVGMAIPDLPRDELAVIAGALPGLGDHMEVTAGPLGLLRLRRLSQVESRRLAWGLQMDRWTRPSCRWVSATPAVLDRFLKRGDEIESKIAFAVTNSRLPEPSRIRLGRQPLLLGGPDFTPVDTLRRPSDRAVKPYRYVDIEFAHPVRGPVVIGSMRHYGLGLCVPVRSGSIG